MANPHTIRGRIGFTLIELIAVCAICLILFVVFIAATSHRGRIRARQETGASNQKALAIGFLQYAQDNDGRFPPVGYNVAPNSLQIHHRGNRNQYQCSWGPDWHYPDGNIVTGMLQPYLMSNALFADPSETTYNHQATALDYMYNDLLATQQQAQTTSPSCTVMITDAEDRVANFGHAYTPDNKPYSGMFNAIGTCDAGKGASVHTARSRYNGGANFAFADGHVKWFEAGPDDPIFFPSRNSASRSAIDPTTKQQLGPIPGGDMTFGGRAFVGTFHVN